MKKSILSISVIAIFIAAIIIGVMYFQQQERSFEQSEYPYIMSLLTNEGEPISDALLDFHNNTPDLYACTSDSDCTWVDASECHCNGEQIAINKQYEERWNQIYTLWKSERSSNENRVPTNEPPNIEFPRCFACYNPPTSVTCQSNHCTLGN